MTTAIKTKRVAIGWGDKKIKVEYYGDKDDFGKAIWYDEAGNAYELIYARHANRYSLNPYPHYNK